MIILYLICPETKSWFSLVSVLSSYLNELFKGNIILISKVTKRLKIIFIKEDHDSWKFALYSYV